MAEVMYDIYKRSPEEALEETFKRAKDRCPWVENEIFTWCSVMGIDGVRYGRYRTVTKKSLTERKYNLEFWDGKVSFLFTDAVHLPRQHKTVLINEIFDEKAENLAR